MKKRILSMVLVVLLLCSMLSISAFASPADPTVTVYITTGMFTQGGYANGAPVIQTYKTNENPANHLMSGYTAITFNMSSINTTSTRAFYNSSLTGPANVLDAIIHAVQVAGQTPSCGWDGSWYPYGGYINSFSPDGVPTYNTPYSDPKVEGGVTVNYTVYSGTGLKVACTQEFEDEDTGTTYTVLDETAYYATNYPLLDNMTIVLDYGPYVIYYA